MNAINTGQVAIIW